MTVGGLPGDCQGVEAIRNMMSGCFGDGSCRGNVFL